MNTRWISISAVTVAFVSGVLVGRGLPDGAVNAPAIAAPRPVPEAAARRVRMPAALRAHAGVATVPLQRSRLAQRLDLTGGVEFNGDHLAEVGSRIAGRIARVHARPGAVVRAGEVLAEIESAAVGEAAAQLHTARAAATASRAELTRVEGLAARSLATARELEQARAAWATNAAQVQGATQRLLAMGLAPGDVAGGGMPRVLVRAPLAGRVVERHAVLGQVVEPATSLFRVADPTRLWVQLRVFERDLPKVTVGDAVALNVASLPGRTFRGAVDHVSPSLDHDTRAARVRVEVTNAEAPAAPGAVRRGAAAHVGERACEVTHARAAPRCRSRAPGGLRRARAAGVRGRDGRPRRGRRRARGGPARAGAGDEVVTEGPSR
jgi:cobalt-zinc-cadmium efflux system membrane fusion protein